MGHFQGGYFNDTRYSQENFVSGPLYLYSLSHFTGKIFTNGIRFTKIVKNFPFKNPVGVCPNFGGCRVRTYAGCRLNTDISFTVYQETLIKGRFDESEPNHQTTIKLQI